MRKWLLSLLAVFGLFFIYIYISYHYGEAKYYKEQRARCEFYEIADLLDEYYKSNNKYPNKDFWVQAISPALPRVKCGRQLTIKNGVVLDLWNDEYRYDFLSENNVNLYSLNIKNISLKLIEGRTLPKDRVLE